MAKEEKIPEKCCAKCRFLLEEPRNNRYDDVDHFCVKLGKYIVGIYKNIDNARFYTGDNKTVDKKAVKKCTFEAKK